MFAGIGRPLSSRESLRICVPDLTIVIFHEIIVLDCVHLLLNSVELPGRSNLSSPSDGDTVEVVVTCTVTAFVAMERDFVKPYKF